MDTTHHMTMTNRDEFGLEEWSCQACARKILFRWPPQYQHTILEDGDRNAYHVGEKGGIKMSAAPKQSGPTAETLQWLNDNGISWDL
jgi:hypothetical protein